MGAFRVAQERGFTIIELMIVVAIIAIIASIAIPNLLGSRIYANESAAIATLKNLSTAQAQAQASGAIDANNNGSGEFGYLGELSGAVGVRDSTGTASATERITPPVLSGAFANVSGSRVQRSGYVFQLYLPDASGTAVPEAAMGGVGAVAPDPAMSEILWMCYAWPASRGNSGNRAFFVNQSVDVLSTRNVAAGQLYSGVASPPAPTAAFLNGTAGAMANSVAANATDLDGGVWIVVN